jgi:hypothetical protein
MFGETSRDMELRPIIGGGCAKIEPVLLMIGGGID